MGWCNDECAYCKERDLFCDDAPDEGICGNEIQARKRMKTEEEEEEDLTESSPAASSFQATRLEQLEQQKLLLQQQKLLLQKQQQELDQRIRDHDAKLASERKKIENRENELKKKERETSKRLQVPAHWKNKTGMHRVATEYVRDALERFMRQSSCCLVTKKTRVVSVERVENEPLWHMYQEKKDFLKQSWAKQTIRSLSTDTNWQPDRADMCAAINEFYLFHGTSPEMAEVICEFGFDTRVADLSCLYGAGTYFAINSCKSHQYCNARLPSCNGITVLHFHVTNR